MAGGDDLAALARDLRKASRGDLRKELTKGLRDSVRPLVPQVRSAIQGIPDAGSGNVLRARMSRAVQIKVTLAGRRTGVRLRLDGGKLGDKAAVARAHERGGTFKHLVFGRPGSFVSQQAHPYLLPTVEPEAPAVVEQCADVMEHALHKMLRG